MLLNHDHILPRSVGGIIRFSSVMGRDSISYGECKR